MNGSPLRLGHQCEVIPVPHPAHPFEKHTPVMGTSFAPRSSSTSSVATLVSPGPAVVPATEIVEALEPNFEKLLPIATLTFSQGFCYRLDPPSPLEGR